MATVTDIKTRRIRRLDNPHNQLGRVYLVLRDADEWLQLHQIGNEILERFELVDSHAAISARIRDLRHFGQVIAHREVAAPGNARPHEYRLMMGRGDGGEAA